MTTTSNKTTKKSKRDTSGSIKREVKTESPTRVPCKVCQPCISPDCGKCEHCEDMIKFGGTGRLRKPCEAVSVKVLVAAAQIDKFDGFFAEGVSSASFAHQHLLQYLRLGRVVRGNKYASR